MNVFIKAKYEVSYLQFKIFKKKEVRGGSDLCTSSTLWESLKFPVNKIETYLKYKNNLLNIFLFHYILPNYRYKR